jgi:group I intron endonuclease
MSSFLNMPGVYKITHCETGRVYFGISNNIRIRMNSHRSARSKARIHRSIRKHGVDAFLFEAFFYVLDVNSDWRNYLVKLEEDLIKKYDSIKNGFNIQERDGSVGPYGQEFRNTIKEKYKDPEYKKRQNDAVMEALKNPEAEKLRRSRLAEAMRSPENRKRVSLQMKERTKDISYRKFLSESAKAMHKNLSDEQRNKRAKKISESQSGVKSEARSKALSKRMADPDSRTQIAKKVKSGWASLTQEQRKQRCENMSKGRINAKRNKKEA